MRTSALAPGAASTRVSGRNTSGDTLMLTTIALILIALWLLGMLTSYTMGGVIHVLLVIAVVVFLVRVIQGRKVA